MVVGATVKSILFFYDERSEVSLHPEAFGGTAKVSLGRDEGGYDSRERPTDELRCA